MKTRTKIATAAYGMDGASLPIKIYRLDKTPVCESLGFLATGFPTCCMSRRMAIRLGIMTAAPDEPFFGKITVGTVENDVIIWIYDNNKMPYGERHEIVLGMSFLKDFECHLDGPGQLVTLYAEIENAYV